MLQAFMTTGGWVIPNTVVCETCLGSAFKRLDTYKRAEEAQVEGEFYNGEGREDLTDIGMTCVYCGAEE